MRFGLWIGRKTEITKKVPSPPGFDPLREIVRVITTINSFMSKKKEKIIDYFSYPELI